MSNGGVNLPLVIQQAGDVSRVQENLQRVSEVQQASATAEAAENREKERSQVQQPEASDAQNRVRSEDQSKKRGMHGKRPITRRQGKKEREQEDKKPASRSKGGVLVDVVI